LHPSPRSRRVHAMRRRRGVTNDDNYRTLSMLVSGGAPNHAEVGHGRQSEAYKERGPD
jgi:hypothetical protein